MEATNEKLKQSASVFEPEFENSDVFEDLTLSPTVVSTRDILQKQEVVDAVTIRRRGTG